MAALTDAQLAEARLDLGTEADEDDLQDRYDRLLLELGDETEALQAAITEVLAQRYADLVAAPASFNTPDYGQNTTENLKALEAKLASRPGGLSRSVVQVVPAPDPRLR